MRIFKFLFLKMAILITALYFFGCSMPTADKMGPSEAYSARAAVNVSNGAQLKTAMENAQPGDTIVLAAGTYTCEPTSFTMDNGIGGTFTKKWFFGSTRNGTATSKITLRSASSTNQAILSGAGWDQLGYGLCIQGDYWIVKDIKVTEAAKGIVIDNANNVLIENVEIYSIGQEGLHFRDGSCNGVADKVNLHDIGKKNDGFGEGIYVGSDNSVWKEGDKVNTGEKGLLYSREVHNTLIKNCIIGPNITAEPFDLKEGATHTTIESCTINGAGISGEHYADSFIDIKGCWTIVRYNTLNQQGNTTVTRAVMIVSRQNAGVADEFTAHDNYVHDNTFNILSDTFIGFSYTGSANIYMWNNTKVPADGNTYSNKIIQNAPEGYNPTDPTDPPPTTPVGPDGYTYSVKEGQSFTFDQKVDVAYGADGKFNYKAGVTGTITFNNATFGDPIHGIAKAGFFKLSVTEGLPTDIIPSENGAITIQYNCSGTAASAKTIKPDIIITNTGTTAIDLSTIALRYYFTDDGKQVVINNPRYVSGTNSANVIQTLSAGSGNRYLQIGFKSGSGVLGAGAQIKIKASFRDSAYGYFNQTNDYSFDATANGNNDYTKITALINGSVIWGSAPY